MDRDRYSSCQVSVSAATTDMKIFLVTLSLIGYTLAEAPYPASGSKPEGALLLLPSEYKQPSYSVSSSQLREADDLSKLNDQVMEKLRQEAGAESGSYHVYLADGRLQKIQYTTAPVLSGQQESQQKSGVQEYSGIQENNQQYLNQYRQSSYTASSSQVSEDQDLSKVNNKDMERLRQQSGSESGSYHVYLADGRLQKVQYTTAPVVSEQEESQQKSSVQEYSGNQQNYQQYSNQYKQSSAQGSGELNPVIAQFGKLQQELQQKQIQQLQQRQQQLELEQQKLQTQQEQLRSANYVASLQYSNVEPITSPVYSYKPSPVTRILRYAPQY